jgi:glucokinase
MEPSGQDRRIVIGVDLGGTNLRIAGVTREGEVLQLRREETRAEAGPEDLLERLAAGLLGVEEVLTRSGWEVLGASLGVPGVISRRRGVVESSPNLPGWKKIHLLRRLRRRVSLPLLLENDANAAVYGEYWAGSGKGKSTIVLLTSPSSGKASLVPAATEGAWSVTPRPGASREGTWASSEGALRKCPPREAGRRPGSIPLHSRET